jgi:hypothetical protein
MANKSLMNKFLWTGMYTVDGRTPSSTKQVVAVGRQVDGNRAANAIVAWFGLYHNVRRTLYTTIPGGMFIGKTITRELLKRGLKRIDNDDAMIMTISDYDRNIANAILVRRLPLASEIEQ